MGIRELLLEEWLKKWVKVLNGKNIYFFSFYFSNEKIFVIFKEEY